MPVATETGPDANLDEPASGGWSIGRIAAVVVVLGMVLFWLWILSGAPAKDNPDRLRDRAFADRTEQRCRELTDQLDELPSALDAKSAAQRADQLEQSTAKVSAMVDAIEADAPTSGPDAVPVKGWIADWRTYIQDREDYAAALRKDPNAKLVLSVNEDLDAGVDETITVFARDANHMNDCVVPGDV